MVMAMSHPTGMAAVLSDLQDGHISGGTLLKLAFGMEVMAS